MESASITAHPSFASSAATVLLPEYIPPKMPITGFFPRMLTETIIYNLSGEQSSDFEQRKFFR
jgi:hypothetical protein